MKKKNTGKLLIEALKEAKRFHEGKVTLRTTQIEMPLDPPAISAKQVRAIRDSWNVSQAVFAKYLGVSDKSVKAWEYGSSYPTGSAARLLQVAALFPSEFQELILKASQNKKVA